MQSSVFNAQCYAARYPDLRLSSVMFYDTKGNFGFGANDNDAFSMLASISGTFFPQIKAHYNLPKDLLLQFQTFGMGENRMGGCDLPGTVYDTAFNSAPYLARYPDLRENPKWVTNPFLHYQTIGQSQGRVPGYEIVNENSQAGLSTPGTTIFVPLAQTTTAQSTTQQNNNAPGDGTVVLNSNGTPIDTTTPAAGSGIMEWIKNNEMLALGIGGVGILLVVELTKKKKK